MACMTSGASSVTLQSLYWRSSNNFSVPAESSRVNWCSPARRLEDEILESRSLFKGRWSKWHTRCGTPRTQLVRANAKCDSPAARGQRWSERRSRRVHLWSEITSRQPGIDVSGIGLDRQGSEPAADRVGAQPGCVHELLAFAQRRIVAEAPERLATRKAGLRDVALDRGKFERERGERPAQPQQRLGLEALDIDLGKGRKAVAGDELVKGGHRNVDTPGPGLAVPARRSVGRRNERRRCGRHRRIVRIELERDRAGIATERRRFDRHGRVAPVEERQDLHQRRLRLDRHHARAEPLKYRGAVADMSADIEYEIAGLHELGVELLHGGAAAPVAIVDAQGAKDPERGP